LRTVRTAVGFCDVSALGKIEVQGADAGIFLDRLYINTFSNLPVGRTRYGVMLREDGAPLRRILFDDAGNAMVPIHATKQSVRYRYYVSDVGKSPGSRPQSIYTRQAKSRK
jgi:folate-binding Fe-S cluster repair protein YgfZ